ncbi:MAG TPA: hypothetical protein VHV82_06045 [Sporichthyaceae bacterium]|nr:hypothetical protein [Sporichthyaceae bacterium]
MAEVEFRLEEDENSDLPRVVNIYLDGRPLRALVGEFERPFAVAAGEPGQAGDYAGLWPPDALAEGGGHFLGEPVEFYRGRSILLGCGCGAAQCHPLTADITIEDTIVTWSGFESAHTGWDLTALGPFVFDRAQYEASLEEARRTWS